MKKTRKITLIAIFSVLVLGLLGVGGYLLYNNLTGSQTGNLAGVEWYSETERNSLYLQLTNFLNWPSCLSITISKDKKSN